jgi:hypothetical protein
VEERIPREDAVSPGSQPLIEQALLFRERVEVVPNVRAPSRRPQTGYSKLRAELLSDLLERVELGYVVASDND